MRCKSHTLVDSKAYKNMQASYTVSLDRNWVSCVFLQARTLSKANKPKGSSDDGRLKPSSEPTCNFTQKLELYRHQAQAKCSQSPALAPKTHRLPRGPDLLLLVLTTVAKSHDSTTLSFFTGARPEDNIALFKKLEVTFKLAASFVALGLARSSSKWAKSSCFACPMPRAHKTTSAILANSHPQRV